MEELDEDWDYFTDDEFSDVGDVKDMRLEFMDQMIKSTFMPILDTFSRDDLDTALEREIYLPEMTASVAPSYLVTLKRIASRIPDEMIQTINKEHVLEWMKDNARDKYLWFTIGNKRKKQRWLQWNIEGYVKFLIEGD